LFLQLPNLGSQIASRCSGWRYEEIRVAQRDGSESREQRAKSREQKVVGAVLEMEEEKLSGERLS
jgi:hypothetical protein